MNSDKLKKLKMLLTSLPERYVGPLTEAVETDRLAGGALPHGEMLDALRPKLRASGSPRAGLPTVSRVVFEPLEDLFLDTIDTPKRRGRISRASLAPIWSWIETDLIPQEMRTLSKGLRKAILSQDTQAVTEGAKATRAKVGAAITGALSGLDPSSPRYETLAAHLGSAAILEDAREIGLLLQAAPTLIEVRQIIRDCSRRLGESDLKSLRDLYDELSQDQPDAAIYIPVVAMRRLARPWQMTDVLRALGRVENDTALSQTTLGLGAELLLDELEDHAEYLCQADLGSPDTAEILRRLGIFADGSAGVSQSFDIKRAGPWGQRLAKIRKRVSDSLEQRVERLPDRLAKAFPTVVAGSYGPKGVHRPDISQWPDEEQVVTAVNIALFLEGSRWDAGKALFAAAHRSAVDKAGRFLVTYADYLVSDIRATEPESEDRERCLAHLEALARCTELVLGSQEADIVRRRFKAAADDTAAA